MLAGTLPWHVRYRAFSGPLPNIVGISIGIVGLSFLVEAGLGTPCLYATTEAQPFIGTITVSSGTLGGLRADETAPIPRASGSLLCPSQLTTAGTGSVTMLGQPGSISVRLI